MSGNTHLNDRSVVNQVPDPKEPTMPGEKHPDEKTEEDKHLDRDGGERQPTDQSSKK